MLKPPGRMAISRVHDLLTERGVRSGPAQVIRIDRMEQPSAGTGQIPRSKKKKARGNDVNDVFTAVNKLVRSCRRYQQLLMELPDAVCLVQQHPSHRAVYAPRVPAGGHRSLLQHPHEICSAPLLYRGVKVLFKKKAEEHTGISPMASFMLSTAMRVGAGNIVGVTGAISTGGGRVVLMWVAASCSAA